MAPKVPKPPKAPLLAAADEAPAAGAVLRPKLRPEAAPDAGAEEAPVAAAEEAKEKEGAEEAAGAAAAEEAPAAGARPAKLNPPLDAALAPAAGAEAKEKPAPVMATIKECGAHKFQWVARSLGRYGRLLFLIPHCKALWHPGKQLMATNLGWPAGQQCHQPCPPVAGALAAGAENRDGALVEAAEEAPNREGAEAAAAGAAELAPNRDGVAGGWAAGAAAGISEGGMT